MDSLAPRAYRVEREALVFCLKDAAQKIRNILLLHSFEVAVLTDRYAWTGA